MTPEIQDALLEPLILHYERDGISDGHFCHIARAIVECCPGNQGRLVDSAVQYMILTHVPPTERPPGAPNSKPGKPQSMP